VALALTQTKFLGFSRFVVKVSAPAISINNERNFAVRTK
jgi:hypothetical protein